VSEVIREIYLNKRPKIRGCVHYFLCVGLRSGLSCNVFKGKAVKPQTSSVNSLCKMTLFFATRGRMYFARPEFASHITVAV